MGNLENVELAVSEKLREVIQEFFMSSDTIDKLLSSTPAQANDRRRVQAIAMIFSYKLLDVQRWVSYGDSGAICREGQGNKLGENFDFVSNVINSFAFY